MMNPACNLCKGGDQEEDPFSSFPEPGIPTSLVSHWNPPYNLIMPSVGFISSLRAHYVAIPNPGGYFVSKEEVLREFRRMRDECKQS